MNGALLLLAGIACFTLAYFLYSRFIAKAIGEKLGIKVYDNELISKAAEESGFSKDLFRRSDEKRSLFTMSTFFSPWRYEVGEN